MKDLTSIKCGNKGFAGWSLWARRLQLVGLKKQCSRCGYHASKVKGRSEAASTRKMLQARVAILHRYAAMTKAREVAACLDHFGLGMVINVGEEPLNRQAEFVDFDARGQTIEQKQYPTLSYSLPPGEFIYEIEGGSGTAPSGGMEGARVHLTPVDQIDLWSHRGFSLAAAIYIDFPLRSFRRQLDGKNKGEALSEDEIKIRNFDGRSVRLSELAVINEVTFTHKPDHEREEPWL